MRIKIDLHLHTKLSSWNGDKIQFENYKQAITTLKQHYVEIASFTDHNVFDLEFYQSAAAYAKSFQIYLLPGVEVAVLNANNQEAHILWMVDPAGDLTNWAALIRLKLGKAKLRLDEFFALVKQANIDSLIIPHVGKSEFLTADELMPYEFDAIEITNFRHHNYLKFQKSKLSRPAVAFSDTHVWKSYPQCHNLITYLEIDAGAVLDFAFIKATLKSKSIKIETRS